MKSHLIPASEWRRKLDALVEERDAPENCSVWTGLRYARENFAVLESRGVSLELPEPRWDSDVLYRAVDKIGDLGHDLVTESEGDGDHAKRKLGCRLKITCSVLVHGLTQAGVPFMDAARFRSSPRSPSVTIPRGDGFPPLADTASVVERMLREQQERRYQLALQGEEVEETP